jgi:hypothetical protein
MPSSLPCFYDLAAVERELRVPASGILGWVRRGDLRAAAIDPGGRPLFRAADVASIGRELASREPVRLFAPRTDATPQAGGQAA